MRGETKAFDAALIACIISIHSPHARGDVDVLPEQHRFMRFQSTPLMRGETPTDRPLSAIATFQSTPLMRGETLDSAKQDHSIYISIHSPHARGDLAFTSSTQSQRTFQSTPLMRGETSQARYYAHAETFQSTPLMRGETWKATITHATLKFQSTPLMRGETSIFKSIRINRGISIHSPHARGDTLARLPLSAQQRDFNPLPSCEGRLARTHDLAKLALFQSTPLMRGETITAGEGVTAESLFQSTPLMRGETILMSTC